MTERSYKATRPAPALLCSECGSWVDDIVAHETWHQTLEQRLAALRDVLLDVKAEVQA